MKIYVPLLQKNPPPSQSRDTKPAFIGVRNEVVRDSSGGEKFITVEVGVGSGQGSYKIAHTEGYPLRYYLAQLKLINLAAHSAVYDLTNLEHGRCRITYVPTAGAVIRLGSSKMGSAAHLQRSSYNPEDLALRMSGGSKVVERNK